MTRPNSRSPTVSGAPQGEWAEAVTLQLPGYLTEPLGWIGLVWPEADEDALFAAGQTWMSYGAALRGQATTANDAAAQVWGSNQGDAVDDFRNWWNAAAGPGHTLDDDATAAEIIGGALVAMAAITLALKLAFIAQLALLAFEVAQAIATAFVSFGATTAEIPGFIAASRVICREAVDKAISMIESEIAHLLEKAAALLEKVGARDLAAGGEKAATRLTAGAQDHMFTNLWSKAERLDVSTPRDGANFWSGRGPDGTSMRSFAEKNTDGVHSLTLEKTPGGRYFDQLDLYGSNTGMVNAAQRDQLWGKLSERYADGATGQATAWVHEPRPTSVWLQRELGALKANPAVTGVRQVDPITGETTWPKGP